MQIAYGHILAWMLATVCWSQSAIDLSPRDLFLESIAQERNPAIHQAADAGLMAPYPLASPGRRYDPPVGMAPLARTSAVPHLGLRYTVLLQESGSRFAPVDIDREFQTGDCVQFEVEPNYAGYLYVFSRGSSGTWQPLFPFRTPGESNHLAGGAKVNVPAEHCFTLDPPSGVERFFLVLGRDQEDLLELNDSIERAVTSGYRAAEQGAAPSRPSGLSGPALGFEELSLQLRDRDVGVKKIEKGIVLEEADHSVYVVNVSDQPVSLLVAELRVRH